MSPADTLGDDVVVVIQVLVGVGEKRDFNFEPRRVDVQADKQTTSTSVSLSLPPELLSCA
jgi:hypothetical protein